MKLSKLQLWDRFQERYTEYSELGLALDLSRMGFADDFFTVMGPKMKHAFAEMQDLEKGAIANRDEGRMVGHYWLRNPELAPTSEIKDAITGTLVAVKAFAAQVHSGEVAGKGGAFKNLLLIGIGGSALGPQFVSRALGHPRTNKLKLFTLDNTDPDGMERVLAEIGNDLDRTLCLVISKSGGTKETRNGMLEIQSAYVRAGLDFGYHAVAVTQEGSELDTFAKKNHWRSGFPMWDWVGGRTSELSAVGLLPAALEGFDIDSLLAGARICDAITRRDNVAANPAAQLALAWHHSGNGIGNKAMVVLPYKDRLELISKYLQQLIMESLGKELDMNGNRVSQGLTVFGNKGSTDQHAYIQQLREGKNNFFAAFIEVLKDRTGQEMEVEPGITSGDYLQGFMLGTRQALYDNERESITLTVHEVSPFTIGVLIALFERAVGYYAMLVNINAYHQPGVEAGKKAATKVIDLELKTLGILSNPVGLALTAKEIANKAGSPEEIETIFKICEHLAANPQRGLRRIDGISRFEGKYQLC